jgi:transcriptional regulator GlxA family with amidase domain
VLIRPGGNGTRRLLRDPVHLDWVRTQRATVSLLVSVCTGSLVYAGAGLLTGRPATTHWASLNLLSELDPTVKTDDDGGLITSAGVSADIDMPCTSLLVSREPSAPCEVRRGIQYDPQPPV